MKILLAVDGSKAAQAATKLAAQMAKAMAAPPTLVLMHSDAPLMRRVAAELGIDATRTYHEGNSNLALKPSRAALKRAGVAFGEKTTVGDPAESITRAAKAGKFDLVIMGSHGRTALSSVLLGSVANKVLSQSTVPVLVVR
ncbi:MAG: universal stress protein [Rhizobium sp.]|nr:universal stress protein [Rhizobium sp.]